MSGHFKNLVLLLLLLIPLESSAAVEEPLPTFAFSWLNDNNNFTAGDTATIKVRVFASNLDVFSKTPLNLTLSVNGKDGNSSYVSGVTSSYAGYPENWSISFIPISSGIFSVLLTDGNYSILDSSLHFEAVPGRINTAACLASWLGLVSDFEAGETATVLILPRDAFGNNVSFAAEEASLYNFTVSAFYMNGSMASLFDVTHMGWNLMEYFTIEFTVIKAGDFLLHVKGENQTLDGSPLSFTVYPGPLDVSSCVAEWKSETNVLQLFSTMKIFVHQKDRYGNLVPGWYAFDAQVVEMGTDVSIPVPNLHFEEVVPGIQLCSSSLREPGNFLLTIYNLEHNISIARMPFEFTVYVGYCHKGNSVINGSGLDTSVAGEVAKFSVDLRDAYQYPAPVELSIFRVQILREEDLYPVFPSIVPLETRNGSVSTHDAISSSESPPAFDSSAHMNDTSGNNKAPRWASFDVTFKPEKSGLYGIYVFCGNIALNGGLRLIKDVATGEIDMSKSGVFQFEPRVSKLRKNCILVQLMDIYSNPIKGQESKLKLDISSVYSSKSKTWNFVDNGNGSYAGFYMVEDNGVHDLCVSFNGKQFQTCPFQVNVYDGEYFPRANSDYISVWEDESIAFDVIANDYFGGGNASIINNSKPAHGTLLQYGQLFRYTPYKGFSGNDSFIYTIVDVNSNLATGGVDISILIAPPQFASFPELLYATEDMISPQFGGFSGFEIKYSDQNEHISVTLHAKFGTILLSPMLMQFGKPMLTGLLLNMGDAAAPDLTMMGNVQALSVALQSIQYLGNGNFSGEDAIILTTRNKNGMNNVKVPVLIDPVNDPPFIQLPDYIILNKVSEDVARVFKDNSNKTDFTIGDPDVPNFPGGESQFLVEFSVEVNTGFLEAELHIDFINTTELVVRNNYHWQPLLTFVTISSHITVKAKGIRFMGTLAHCQEILQQLLYNGRDAAAILTITLNDLGNYGCYGDCTEKLAKPLFTEASTVLVRRKPMSPLAARIIGSAIIIELIALSVLGAMLVFYTCKSIRSLANETSSRSSTLDQSPLHHPVTTSQDKENLSDGFPNPFLRRAGQPPAFRQRSGRLTTPLSPHLAISSSPLHAFRPLSIEKGESATI